MPVRVTVLVLLESRQRVALLTLHAPMLERREGRDARIASADLQMID